MSNDYVVERCLPEINNREKPLVSILVYNYNYGRYLRECLDSLVAQTYPNIEINFSDNYSEDDSWDIAIEYAKKYPGIFTITQNRQNFGTGPNFRNCSINLRGKYFINMCSDDVLLPDFISRCVAILQSNSEIGYVMTHRAIIDADSVRTEELPFYNQSCVIPGHEQAAVYMMAAVNPSVSQILYSVKHTKGTSAGGLASEWYGTRIYDFNICLEYSMAYIKEPLMLHRIHGLNESLKAADKLLEVIGAYVVHVQFADIASRRSLNKVSERLPKSISKLALLSLRYCIRALINENEILAKKYFHLALCLDHNYEEHDITRKLQRYWLAEGEERLHILDSFESNASEGIISRMTSYAPPEGSILL